MKITETQIAHVNKQIEALISADSFYGKKLHEAGISKISSAEDFEQLPFSEKKDLREAYPLGLMTAPEEKSSGSILPPVPPVSRSLFLIPPRMLTTGQSCSSVVMRWRALPIWIVFR